MISSLKTVAANFRFADILDIAIVSFFLYFLFIWIRRRASRSVVFGISLVIILYSLAHALNMYMTSQVFQAGLAAALVALVLIFQEDIRMAVEHLASLQTFHSKHQLVASMKTVDALVEGFTNLARDRIGALVVIKGRESLERHLNGGILISGRISVPLLYSIFHPETPNHDGAAIIEGDRIEKFGVRLPLSHNLAEVGESGTRHTAALGLAERSDALVIVVSEERGTISIAEDGRLERVDKEKLRKRLDGFYKMIFPPPAERTHFSFFTHNLGIKTTSVIFATMLWFLLAFRVETVNRSFTIPIEYRNVPVNWVIADPRPSELRISLSGLERSFKFDPSTLVASLDASDIKEGYQTVTLTEDDLNIPRGLEVNQITPHSFSFRAYKIDQIDLPVKVKVSGRIPDNLGLTELKPYPSSVRVTIPHSRIGTVEEINTESLNLNKINQNTSLKLKLLIPPDVQIDQSQSIVKVSVSVIDKSSSTDTDKKN